MKRSRSLFLVMLGGLALAGCGGGGSGSDSVAAGESDQNPVVAVGRIDAFGSVFVNGVEYETSRASYDVDGASGAGDGSLSVGMIVRVRGTRDDHGHGVATEIRYDDEVDGPAADVTVDPADSTIKHFTVFGLGVVANGTTVFRGEHGMTYTFDDLADGDHVEVSGDYDGDTLIATFIELQDASDTSYEAKGTVSDLNGSMFVLTLHNGATLNVTLADGAMVPAGLMDGSLIEVKGTIPDASMPHEFLADRVKLGDHDDFDGEGHDENEHGCDLGGVLSFDGTVWSVRGTELAFSDTTDYRPASLAAAIADGSAAGLRVYLSGPIVDGVLQVERIWADGRADGSDEFKLKGYVHSVAPDAASGTTTIELSFPPADGTAFVVVDSQTLLMDDDHLGGVDLTALDPDVSFIRVRGHVDASGMLIASALKVESSPEGYEVEGPLDTDGLVADVSVSVLGVTFMLDAETRLEGGTPAAGDFVQVVDFDRDGFADKVERDDDYHDGEFGGRWHD